MFKSLYIAGANQNGKIYLQVLFFVTSSSRAKDTAGQMTLVFFFFLLFHLTALPTRYFCFRAGNAKAVRGLCLPSRHTGSRGSALLLPPPQTAVRSRSQLGRRSQPLTSRLSFTSCMVALLHSLGLPKAPISVKSKRQTAAGTELVNNPSRHISKPQIPHNSTC